MSKWDLAVTQPPATDNDTPPVSPARRDEMSFGRAGAGVAAMGSVRLQQGVGAVVSRWQQARCRGGRC